MSTIDLGKLDNLRPYTTLYIQLKPNDKGVTPYENIVLQYGEEQLTIPIERFFEKMKELFKEELK